MMKLPQLIISLGVNVHAYVVDDFSKDAIFAE
jgi:hypothetical protein